MNTRQRSQMPPNPPASYRTPLPTPEVNQDGILHPALIPRRRVASSPFHRIHTPTKTGPGRPDVRPRAVPGYAPAQTASDRDRDDRLFEDLVANAADANHTRDRDEIEAGDDFLGGDLDDLPTDEAAKGARRDDDELFAGDDEEARQPETPED